MVAFGKFSGTAKGDRGPDEWMPQDPSFRCEYLRRRLSILSQWRLWYDCALYLRLMSEHCH